jgi:uncharacterized GH25 family protein
VKSTVLIGAAASALMLAIVNAASAHDLVLVPRAAQTVTLEFGHPGEFQPPQGARFLRLDIYDTEHDAPVSLLDRLDEGAASFLDLRVPSARVTPAIVAAQYDNGYWCTLDGKRYVNSSKLHVTGAKDSGSFLKFAKALFPDAASKGAFKRVLGQELEIIPLDDPFAAPIGGWLRIQIRFQGQPLPGANVEVSDGITRIPEARIPRFVTDKNGIASAPIARPGLCIIEVDHQTPPLLPRLCDHDDYGATLSFEAGSGLSARPR